MQCCFSIKDGFLKNNFSLIFILFIVISMYIILTHLVIFVVLKSIEKII